MKDRTLIRWYGIIYWSFRREWEATTVFLLPRFYNLLRTGGPAQILVG